MFKPSWESWTWSGIYIVLLLSLLTPLNILSVNLIMIPIVILFVRLDTKRFVIHYAVSLLFVLLITGGAGPAIVFIALFFLLPSLILAYFYKKKAAARTVLTAGMITLLTQFLLSLVLIYLFGININQTISQFVSQSMEQIPEVLRMDITGEVLDQAIRMMTKMIPLYLISISFYYIVITHWISRRLLNKAGEQIPPLRPAKEWMLPKSFVWYYLIASIFNLFVDIRSETVMNTILWNFIPLMMFAFSIQAVGFLFYLADLKKWNKTLPIIGILMLPFFSNILSLLGLFDVAFNLRKRLENHKK